MLPSPLHRYDISRQDPGNRGMVPIIRMPIETESRQEKPQLDYFYRVQREISTVGNAVLSE